jgi:hypothetical protein
MTEFDALVAEHLDPEVAQRLAGAIRRARTRPVLLLSDAKHNGDFGLLLLTEDGIEFLAPDGRSLVEARDDIVFADPRSRGSLAVTFTDGHELTFTDLGDSTWTRQFAQAVNDLVAAEAPGPVVSQERRSARLPLKTPQETRHPGALYVALGLKVFAALAVIGGFILAIDGANAISDEGGDVAQYLGYSFAGTILTALLLAFLGYTLEVLVDIWENTWIVRANAEED